MGPKAGSSIPGSVALNFAVWSQAAGKRQENETLGTVLRITVNFEGANPKPESGRKLVAEFGLLRRRELHFNFVVQETARSPKRGRNGKSTSLLGPSFTSKSDEIIDGRGRIST